MASHKPLLIAAAAMGVVIVGALLPATASAAVYRVGDDSGWAPGVDYNAWASGKTFHVGEILEFVYSVDSHSVAAVDAASYEACTAPTMSRTNGDGRVTLVGKGQAFFICGFKDNCQSGMKLTVHVRAPR